MRMGMLRPMNSNDMTKLSLGRPIAATSGSSPSRANAPRRERRLRIRNQCRNRQSDKHGQQRDQPAAFDLVFSVPHQSRGQRIVSEQPELAIGRGDLSPVRGILLTDLAGSSPDQRSVRAASNSRASRLFFAE